MNNISNVNNTDSVFISGKTAAETARINALENSVSDKIKTDEKEARTDSYTKSTESEQDTTGIYSRESLLEQLRDAEEQRVAAFQDTIRSMMAQQGQTVNLTFRGIDLHVTEQQSAEAKKAISEGGEYSINAVSDRIMNMAKALSGGDSSKISMLREAVQKGFGGAMSLLGRKQDDMPSITKDTYSEIMNRFDEWENSFKTTEPVETEVAS